MNFQWDHELLLWLAKFIHSSVDFYHFCHVNKACGNIGNLLQDMKMNDFSVEFIVRSHFTNSNSFHKRNKLPNGTLHGEESFHLRADLVTESTNYRNGRKHGKHVRRRSQGDIYTIEFYENDKLKEVEYLKSFSIFAHRYDFRDPPRFYNEIDGNYRCNGEYDECSELPLDCATRRKLLREIQNFQFL